MEWDRGTMISLGLVLMIGEVMGVNSDKPQQRTSCKKENAHFWFLTVPKNQCHNASAAVPIALPRCFSRILTLNWGKSKCGMRPCRRCLLQELANPFVVHDLNFNHFSILRAILSFLRLLATCLIYFSLFFAMCFNCLNTLNSFWLRSLRSQAFRRWTRCFHCLSNPTTSWRTAAARTRQRQVTPMWRILSLIRVCRTEGCAACCGSILSGSCSMALVKMDFLPSMLLWNEIEESHNYTLQLQCFCRICSCPSLKSWMMNCTRLFSSTAPRL